MLSVSLTPKDIPALKKAILIFLAVMAFELLQAQPQHTDTLEVYFRQGYSTWEPQYKGNGERLEAFVERLQKLHSDKIFNRISKIHIVAGCSPEGSWVFNQRLSKNRARRMRDVLKSYIALPDSVIVEDSRGINWAELRRMVEADPNMPYKDEVL